MKKKTWIITFAFVSTIVWGNVFSEAINLIVFGVGRSYTYETFDGKFKFSYHPSKGGELRTVLSRFENLQHEVPSYREPSLLRTFKKSPFQFWNWYAYYYSDRYDFPFKTSSGNSVHYKGLGGQ